MGIGNTLHERARYGGEKGDGDGSGGYEGGARAAGYNVDPAHPGAHRKA